MLESRPQCPARHALFAQSQTRSYVSRRYWKQMYPQTTCYHPTRIFLTYLCPPADCGCRKQDRPQTSPCTFRPVFLLDASPVCLCVTKRKVLNIMLTSRSPEIGYLALAQVLGQEHVGRLDVAVRKAHLVHVRQTSRPAAAESLRRCGVDHWFTRDLGIALVWCL